LFASVQPVEPVPSLQLPVSVVRVAVRAEPDAVALIVLFVVPLSARLFA
jgi:hypothetical protein